MNLDFYNLSLQKFLQSKITIKCDNKVLKTGKLKLFTVKQYFIRFYLENEKKENKVLELPYPFLVHNENNMLTFNYKLTSLSFNNNKMTARLKYLKNSTTSKVFDNFVEIIPFK